MSFLNKLLDTANGSVDILNKNLDKILLVSGFVAGAVTIVTACKGTLKAEKILEDHKERSKKIEKAIAAYPEYKTDKAFAMDVINVYSKTGVELGKTYAVPFIFGVAASACFIGEHIVMQKRVNKLEGVIASLSAAYIAIDKAFKAYRKRVIEKYGKEEDQYLRYGAERRLIETKDEQTGEVRREERIFIENGHHSEYAKFFDELSTECRYMDPYHNKIDWEANKTFLMIQEGAANSRLKAKGYLFLNEVYDMLGLQPTKAGQSVGWIYNPEDKSIDSYVSFNIFDKINRRLVNGFEEDTILLDFNVDGRIFDRI